MSGDLSAEQLREVYRWVDQVPLSRPKKNIARDFSDAVLVSEIINYIYPNMVETHNYSPTNSVAQKMYNWETMNKKVFKKMGFQIPAQQLSDVAASKKGCIEGVLYRIREGMATFGGSEGKTVATKAKNGRGADYFHSGGSPVKKGSSVRSQNNNPPTGQHISPGPSPQQHKQGFNKSPQHSSNNKGGGEIGELRGQLGEQDVVISDLRDTLDIMRLKISKMQQLLDLKNQKIETLTSKLQEFL
jgi:uncharacterized coiled-coil protein SlyX